MDTGKFLSTFLGKHMLPGQRFPRPNIAEAFLRFNQFNLNLNLWAIVAPLVVNFLWCMLKTAYDHAVSSC